MLSIARPSRQAVRGLLSRTSPLVSSTSITTTSSNQSQRPVPSAALLSSAAPAAMAGSPLFFTEFDKPFYAAELPFAISGIIDGLVQSWGETENGPLLLAGLVGVTSLRMMIYYGFFQPSYLWHFQETYGQSWKVGHHLYGHNLPNPLKK